MSMIPVRVGGLAIDERTKSPVVLLQEIEGNRVLPIWIGPMEASAIHMELLGKKYQRPLTHDLMINIMEGLNAKVSRVVITDLKDSTFFANIYVDGGSGVSASAVVRDLVARRRLSRSACFRAVFQRRPAMDSPARLMSADAPASSRARPPASPSGFQPIRVMPGLPVPDSCCACPGGSDRVSTRRSWLSSAHAQARALPRNPVPPAMTTFIVLLLDVWAPL